MKAKEKTTWFTVCRVTSFDAREANAVLIARAPEMAAEIDRLTAENERLRAAAREVVKMWDDYAADDDQMYPEDFHVEPLRDVLAKASGEGV